jgi:hypothetical protein
MSAGGLARGGWGKQMGRPKQNYPTQVRSLLYFFVFFLFSIFNSRIHFKLQFPLCLNSSNLFKMYNTQSNMNAKFKFYSLLFMSCDGTSQVIRPTYSCPCPTDIRHPIDVPKSLDKFGIFFLTFPGTFHPSCRHYRSSEIKKCGSDYITYIYLKSKIKLLITDQSYPRSAE